jgi:hypothetical protein
MLIFCEFIFIQKNLHEIGFFYCFSGWVEFYGRSESCECSFPFDLQIRSCRGFWREIDWLLLEEWLDEIEAERSKSRIK